MKMKIAIVCDWLVTVGGAEKVLHEIIACFPEAELYAIVDFLESEQRSILCHKKVQTSFIQHLPFAKQFYRHYLPLMPLAIEQFDLSSYDLVISSSHAVAKGVITSPNQVHISYVHSPMRYAWDLQTQYLNESGLTKKWRGYLAKYLLHRLRMWDLRTHYGVDHFVANSHFIAKRIFKVYRRTADVIHPPVACNQFEINEQKKDFYLTASRLVPYKRIDLIIKAFSRCPDKRLIVIGDGPEFKKLKSLATDNVTLMGYQPDVVLKKYMKEAKAFIFAALEDFGIVPLEAQASGTPVIAFGRGGALETVRGLNTDQPTGVFFKDQTVDSLIEAIKTFEQHQDQFLTKHCVKQAKRFSKEIFRERLINFVTEKMETTN